MLDDWAGPAQAEMRRFQSRGEVGGVSRKDAEVRTATELRCFASLREKLAVGAKLHPAACWACFSIASNRSQAL